MRTTSLWVGAVVIATLVVGCKDYEPGVAAVEDLGSFMKKARKKEDCLMLPKVFGDEANEHADALMKLPTKHVDDFKDDVKALEEKFGSRLDGPCDDVIDAAKACRVDGASNMSGHGQSVVDVCKALKGIDEKIEPER